jgi:two-component system, sensor histidine kinase RegB
VTISASTLGIRSTLILGGLSFACLTVLSIFHLPLPWVEGQTFTLPAIYVLGIWVALTIGLLFTALYAWRVSRETERMRAAMDATSQVLAREQRLAALGALAAAAAHELGTPLATIALVAKELERDMGSDTPYAEDLVLLRSQAERCREILSRLSERPGQGDAVHERADLGALLEEVVAPHRDFGVTIAVHLHKGGAADLKEPVVWRRPEILYGLRNLVENAVDFARARVSVDASWTSRGVEVRISDDGPGFAPEIMDKLGEPYVTTRPAMRGAGGMDDSDPSPHGMGLGFFIAKTLLEQSGARVTFRNLPEGAPPGARGGASVTVSWPRDVVTVS